MHRASTAPTSATSTRRLVGEPVDLVVGDLSFISLRLVLAAAAARGRGPDADLVLMVKPQFEVGRERLGRAGWCATAGRARTPSAPWRPPPRELGLGCRGVMASPLPGPSGNVEYFLWLRAGAPPLDDDRLERAVARGAGLTAAASERGLGGRQPRRCRGRA